MKKPQQQKGFTLIELIIVIIILGILAVTAAPRFLDLSSDARTSAMQGVLGAVRSSSQIAHAALLVRTGDVTIEGVAIQTTTPDVQAIGDYALAEDMCDLIGLTTDDGAAGAIGTQGTPGTQEDGDSLDCAVASNVLTITDNAATDPATCVVTYAEATVTGTAPNIVITPPVIGAVITGC
ncbi:prepilin-type N-terminal cleavage/methylation domain-containing protein [Alteromonadaceae bacterium M269]|nr:prepilin-type N-terminal cleavage/methylation domain-containing protein [Alteromonadaceae bacterium M269]